MICAHDEIDAVKTVGRVAVSQSCGDAALTFLFRADDLTGCFIEQN